MNAPAVLPIHNIVPGRARFRVEGLKRSERVKRVLETALAGRGIHSVIASTMTGTVLVLFEREHDVSEIAHRLNDAAERRGVMDAEPMERPPTTRSPTGSERTRPLIQSAISV